VESVKEVLRKWALAVKLANVTGWWLRSTIIWQKSNGVPSGASDRPSTDFEYVFLLSKAKSYYYDVEAIKEPQKPDSIRRAFANNHLDKRKDNGKDIYALSSAAQSQMHERLMESINQGEKPLRNKRCVWNIATQGLRDEHYAVFPERLIEPMILAGSSPMVCAECSAPYFRIRKTSEFEPSCSCCAESAKSIILDPFMGAGTTAVVSAKLGRDFIGIETGEKYVALAKRRLQKIGLKLSI